MSIIELKLFPFQPEHAGQMEWYLKWLEKHESVLIDKTVTYFMPE